MPDDEPLSWRWKIVVGVLCAPIVVLVGGFVLMLYGVFAWEWAKAIGAFLAAGGWVLAVLAAVLGWGWLSVENERGR